MYEMRDLYEALRKGTLRSCCHDLAGTKLRSRYARDHHQHIGKAWHIKNLPGAGLLSIKESPANQVLDFIRQIEQSTQTLYKVESMSYRPVLKKPGIYDFSIQISGFQRKNDGK